MILFLIALLTAATMDSQNLKTHQWNNRIILVFSADGESPHFEKQIADLKQASDGCAERKLVMYQIVPSEIHVNYFNNNESKKWNATSDLYKEFMEKDDAFKVVLIGLDGSVKEERDEPIASKELFKIIDGMSMRQEEMRKQD
jgi:hypothetical protein